MAPYTNLKMVSYRSRGWTAITANGIGHSGFISGETNYDISAQTGWSGLTLQAGNDGGSIAPYWTISQLILS